ncbi:MarR family winged helix-turn-helix transcriptional regulator [Actinophytocola gossypii]|uniref:MarR family transcriptional regulator n=1 Tax=Actinophytocola gossypii TaxID=2812003 RepID=A0ABT2J6C6_9PSEU|nr:MarR family transcriptional regulator [Actinophytocola gossypii]MCT2582819.1 MarR family transcriptional regulator [Actinophytocola gossypii]
MTALDGDLGWTLGVVFRAYLKASSAAMTDIPGEHRGYQVLTAAARDEAPSQSALGERLGIDRTVLTYLLDDLERADLVARRPDPADRRTRRIVATDNGRALLRRLEDRLAQAEARVLAGLPGEDQVTLKALLRRLAAHTNALDPVEDACAVVEDIRAGS